MNTVRPFSLPSRGQLLGSLALVAASLVAPSASALIYTSEAAYAAATSGLTTVDFNGIAAPGGFVGYGGGPLSLSGVTFSTPSGSMFVIDPAYYGSSYAGGGFLNSDYSSTGVNTVNATLPSAATAVGLNFGGLFSGPVTFAFTLSDGSAFSYSTPHSITGDSSLGFFGVTSPVPITSIAISMPDSPSYNAIDNFSFGTAVPDGGSALALMGVGVGLVGFAARRRQ